LLLLLGDDHSQLPMVTAAAAEMAANDSQGRPYKPL